MTELMKQFQDETGIDLFGGWSYQVVNGMMTPPLSESPWMKFIQWLCNKLTWRPVSDELPSVEKDGDAIIGRHKDVDEGLVQFDCISTVWFIDNYEGWYTHWLPIPPAPEGGIV